MERDVKRWKMSDSFVRERLEAREWLVAIQQTASHDMEMFDFWYVPALLLDNKGYPMNVFWEDVEEVAEGDDRYQQNKYFQEYVQTFIDQIDAGLQDRVKFLENIQ